MESITIDFDRIPDKEKRVLGDTLFTACKAFYENPDNLARYNASSSATTSRLRSLITTL